MKRVLAFPSILLILVAGCGYNFSGTIRERPGGVRRITIPIVQNATNHTDLTNALTNRLIQEFNLSRAVAITVPDQAEAALEVSIISVQIESAALAASGQESASRRVLVVVNAQLRRLEDQNMLWSKSGMVVSKSYITSTDQTIVESNLLAAKADAADELAEKIHNDLFEGF